MTRLRSHLRKSLRQFLQGLETTLFLLAIPIIIRYQVALAVRGLKVVLAPTHMQLALEITLLSLTVGKD